MEVGCYKINVLKGFLVVHNDPLAIKSRSLDSANKII